jgi:hypothetical protein
MIETSQLIKAMLVFSCGTADQEEAPTRDRKLFGHHPRRDQRQELRLAETSIRRDIHAIQVNRCGRGVGRTKEHMQPSLKPLRVLDMTVRKVSRHRPGVATPKHHTESPAFRFWDYQVRITPCLCGKAIWIGGCLFGLRGEDLCMPMEGREQACRGKRVAASQTESPRCPRAFKSHRTLDPTGEEITWCKVFRLGSESGVTRQETEQEEKTGSPHGQCPLFSNLGIPAVGSMVVCQFGG